MKKLAMLVLAAAFSFTSAAYACDGVKKAKHDKSGTVAKKENKAPKSDKKS